LAASRAYSSSYAWCCGSRGRAFASSTCCGSLSSASPRFSPFRSHCAWSCLIRWATFRCLRDSRVGGYGVRRPRIKSSLYSCICATAALGLSTSASLALRMAVLGCGCSGLGAFVSALWLQSAVWCQSCRAVLPRWGVGQRYWVEWALSTSRGAFRSWGNSAAWVQGLVLSLLGIPVKFTARAHPVLVLSVLGAPVLGCRLDVGGFGTLGMVLGLEISLPWCVGMGQPGQVVGSSVLVAFVFRHRVCFTWGSGSWGCTRGILASPRWSRSWRLGPRFWCWVRCTRS
jgi:hypothetical protein